MGLAPWDRYRKLSLFVPPLDLLVDCSKSALSDDAFVSDPLAGKPFADAFAAMTGLESGAVANPDEGRRVGHYWLRAPELAPDAETREAIVTALSRVRKFAA